MILPVIGTIATRVLIAAMNLLLLVLAARALGPDGVGAISLIVLGITFILLLNNVVGGGGLVYLSARHADSALRLPSYGWALLTAAVAWAVLRMLPVVPDGFADHVVLLALLQSIASVHTNLLLGRERIGMQNTMLLLQTALLLGSFAVLLRRDDATVLDYVHAAYIAHGTTALLSGLASLRGRNARASLAGAPAAVADLFRQGLLAQAANALQLLNYRFAYYLVERFQGTSLLGVYAVTTQLAESAWLAPKSLGTVLYARVSNMGALEQQRDTTLSVLKLAVGIAVVTVLVLIAVPDALYARLFGPEIRGLRPIVLAMAPGLIAMSASQAYSHFLSGSGRVHHNTIGSGIGLVITIALGFALIPVLGLVGAAFTTSAAYSASVIYQAIVFDRITHARLRHYLPAASDLERIGVVWRRLMGR
ncbi:MAG: polysaccharide biosynthesis C-terminal domain-containing protein [Flavobacteriales bacterium]|nr:polysaccharide biosynthesis C-terminal domain-containing protein [Flavobacteriales bacterium]